MCETAAKRIDSRARLQFRFFLNVFNCLLTTNLSRRNNRSRTGPQTLFNFRRNCNRRWISIKFHVYSRYLVANRVVHSTTTGCKWLIFHFTTIMRNQSVHTAWVRYKLYVGNDNRGAQFNLNYRRVSRVQCFAHGDNEMESRSIPSLENMSLAPLITRVNGIWTKWILFFLSIAIN